MSIKFPALDEAQGKLKAKQKEIGDIFAEAGPDMDFNKVKSVSGAHDSRGVAAHVRALNDEAEALQKEVQDLQGSLKAAEANQAGFQVPGSAEGEGAETKGDVRSFAKAAVDTGFASTKGSSFEVDVDLKTLMSTGAGFAPEVQRTGRVVPFALTPIDFLDIIPSTTTSQAAVKYMEETTATNASAETAESVQGTLATYPESALAYTEKVSPVQKIATFLPASDEQLEDEPQLRSMIENRLTYFIRQRLNGQVLSGNGTAPNLRGLLNVVGIQTQAKGTDPSPDAVYKAIVKCQIGSGQANPNAVGMNPVDWQNVRLLRTADGIYIWGSPSEAGPSSIWGLPVVSTQALTAGTAVVGDFANFAELNVRRGIEVQVSNSHGTNFVNGVQAIRADMRAAFVVYRPAAFCTVTGL